MLNRKKRYQISKEPGLSGNIEKFYIGKGVYSRRVLERAVRDHSLQVDIDKIGRASEFLKCSLQNIEQCKDMDQLRGYEARLPAFTFGVFDQLILQQKKDFCIWKLGQGVLHKQLNAMLSFVLYTFGKYGCSRP